MKFVAVLAASAYAATLTPGTAPTASNSGDTAVSMTWPADQGTMTVTLLAAKNATDVEGYYEKVVTAGGTKDWAGTGIIQVPGSGALHATEFGLIVYTDNSGNDFKGQQILWQVTQNVAETNGATDFTDGEFKQLFNKSGTITAAGNTALVPIANTGTNAWVLTAVKKTFYSDTSAPASTLWRLTPDESTETDARPVVGDKAGAYYGFKTAASAVSIDGAATLGSTGKVAEFTWSGATSMAAVATAAVAASLF